MKQQFQPHTPVNHRRQPFKPLQDAKGTSERSVVVITGAVNA